MDELIKALGRFVARDLVFIVGGSSVILTTVYAFGRLSAVDLPVPYYLLGAGFSYVLGYAIQELFGLTPILTMADYFQPGGFVRFLYQQFTGDPWQDIPKFDPYEVDVTIRTRESAGLAFLERLVSLRQVGSTMGSCALVSAVPLFLRAFSKEGAPFDLFLAVAAAVLGIGLVCLSWVKAAQQMHYMNALRRAHRNSNGDA